MREDVADLRHDERQLQPIDAGGALHAVDDELIKVAPGASSQIQTIRRQKDDWMRNAVYQAAQGKTAEALKVSAVTVMRDWSTARAWLYRELTGGTDDGCGTVETDR